LTVTVRTALVVSQFKLTIRHGWRAHIAVLIAGLLLPLSFAPFNIWPIAILSLAVLTYLLQDLNAKQTMICGFVFALGMFASGVHWTFVPIDQFSSTPVVLSVLIILVFVLALAVVFYALPFYCLGRWCSRHSLGLLLGLPAIWLITEWLRTWLFTGFPWLFLGYGHLNTWLSGWAPITGVMGISFLVCFTASTLVFCWRQRHKKLMAVSTAGVCALFWLAGLVFSNIQWTQSFGEPVKVGLAQGNIPQEKKWEESFLKPTLDRYQTLTNELWGNDWIVWPEAAVPMIANTVRDHARLQPYLADLKQQAVTHNAALITGILYLSPENNKAYNSIIATGLGAGIYFKRRLVPFGEYAPLEDYLGGLFNFFNIQRSMIALGPANQRGLQVGSAILAPSICYEIVYPDLVAGGAENANVLITISNDAWFGRSIGPLQHMQMARMRALETQRYLIRGTNNGVSALVNDKGEIIVKSDRYVMQSIAGEIELRQGMTPFMVIGSEPVVFLSLVILGVLGFLQYRK
jgi:apolipoprotein N-acyltransferase